MSCARKSLAIFAGLGTILSGMLSCCCWCSDKLYCSLVIIYVFAAMSQGLTLIDLFEAGGEDAVIFSISAIIVWLLCAGLAWISKIEKEKEEQAEEQVEHYNNLPIIANAVLASEEPIVNETVTVREDGTK
eukprot:15361255-Ditylum_brightwellii.AAC.1